MNVRLKWQESRMVIEGLIEGEIDSYTASILKDQLEVILLLEGFLIVLDFSKVTYMDSSGLGVLVAFYKKVTKENASLKLVNLSKQMMRMFKLTGLSEFIDTEARNY